METLTNWKNGFEKHYLFTTTLIAIFVAAGNLSLLYYMHLDKISNGIGLAMVGIVTFFGMLIVSSFFEEHRHEHASNSKKEGSQNTSTAAQKMVEKVVAGKGIMRKALASSLIIVYIIVIGLYVESGELSEAKQIPRSLLEHFTIVVTAIVIFYFGSDIATIWFKNKYASSSTAGGTSASDAGTITTGKKKKSKKVGTEANSDSE